MDSGIKKNIIDNNHFKLGMHLESSNIILIGRLAFNEATRTYKNI